MDGIRKMELACFSDKGTVRTNNEDNMYFSHYNITNENSEDYYCATFSDEYDKDLKVVAIFDGMGGTEGGEIASLASAKQMTILFERLKEKQVWSDEELSYLLLDTKKRMEHETRMVMENPQAEQPGTTCCGFILHNGMLKPFWIGDSRLYLLRKNQLILITKDHTIAQEKIDYGLITPEEATTVSSWHYITAYIGDNRENFTLSEAFSVNPGDKFLLCTDGVSDKLSAETIAEYLSESPIHFIENVTREVKKSSKDNATAIVLHLIPEGDNLGMYMKNKAKDYFYAIGESVKRKGKKI